MREGEGQRGREKKKKIYNNTSKSIFMAHIFKVAWFLLIKYNSLVENFETAYKQEKIEIITNPTTQY